MWKDIDSFVESRRKELVRIASELIATNTETPPGRERLAAKVVQKYLDSMGIRHESFEKEPERTNVVARVGSGSPSLLVACHLDVVPAGDGWSQDPFKATVTDGKMIGRGATDNKGQMASCMILAEYLMRKEDSLNGEFILVAAADEERGSRLGLEYLLDECGLRADYAIIPDISYSMRKIDVSEKGALFLEVTSHGKQAHGSLPETGVNAIWNMVELLKEIETLPSAFKHTSHPLFTPPTLNLGTIQGGAARNIVPGKCVAGLDIRYLPGDTKEDIIALVEERVKKVERANPQARFELKVGFDLPPSEVAYDNPLVGLIQRHTEDVLGVKPELIGMPGTTVTKQLLDKGVTAVGFGPGEESQAHMADEFIEIQQLVDFAKIMARISCELLG
ncbi:MAG: M20 family metallopeptidase [Planctomycetota bacterium]|jgi:acetylornithine deacetylase/succinyl-diaminopimelate desuccinylase family protein